VGDPVIGNLTKVLPKARGYPVQYPASTDRTGGAQGAKDIISRLQNQVKECPNEKFALVGYSQGASVVRAAAKDIPVDIQSKIVALVMFGDPGLKRGERFAPALEAKLLENCAQGDMVSCPDMFLFSVVRSRVCGTGDQGSNKRCHWKANPG
jgi:cutinase